MPRLSAVDGEAGANAATATVSGSSKEPRAVSEGHGEGHGARLPVVAMIGGGQLARMTQQAAIALGQSLRVLAESPNDPAAQVCPDVVFGTHSDPAALAAVAEGAAAVTFDHEQVPNELIEALVERGVPVSPSPAALVYAQDKLVMRRRMASLNIAQPAFAQVESVDDVAKFGAERGWPVILKAATGGYDGRGVWFVESTEEAAEILAGGPDVEFLVEERVDLKRELSALVAHSPFGQGAAWPIVETVQVNGQCSVVIAPAAGLPDEVALAAEEMGLRIANELAVVGVMAVELFETNSGELLVNELAMRPHNSGHWSMDGSRTSQFEQHLRAVLDYPLGDTRPIAPVTVMANVLGAEKAPEMSMDERIHHLFARMPDAKVHMYGKSERQDRKIGHVNIVGEADGSLADAEYVEAVRARAELAAKFLSTAVWTDGWDPHK